MPKKIEKLAKPAPQFVPMSTVVFRTRSKRYAEIPQESQFEADASDGVGRWSDDSAEG